MTERTPQTVSAMAEGEMAKNPLLEIAPLTTLAVHVIAANHPKVQRIATATARSYRIALHNADLGQEMGAEAQEYVNNIASIRRDRANTIAKLAQDETRSTQDRIEMWESIGMDPTANDIADSFQNLDRAEQAQEEQRAVRDRTDPEIIAAQEDLLEQLVASGEAQLEAAGLREEFELATAITQESLRLGRGGRIKARLAGLAVGIGAGLSILGALDHSEPARQETSISQPSLLDNTRFAGVAMGATSLVGLAGGFGVAHVGNGYFAQRAARREVSQQ